MTHPHLQSVALEHASRLVNHGDTGSELDKFERHRIAALPGPVLGLPWLHEGCVAWLECRLLPEPHTEDTYDTCFGEVVAAAADERVFSRVRWDFRADNAELHTIHHLGAGNFVTVGQVIRAQPLP